MEKVNFKIFFKLGFFLLAGSVLGCSAKRDKKTVGTQKFNPVHQLLNKHVKQKRIAGANALVIQDGEVVYRDQVGWMDIEEQKSMKNDAIFRIASMTKAVTAVGIMMLREKGKLKLTDTVSEFIPSFSNFQVVTKWDTSSTGSVTPETIPANQDITIHDLLTHLSGLSYRFMSDDNFANLYQSAGVSDGLVQTDITLTENMNRLGSLPLMYQPGTVWHYSLSYDVLGRVIEVVSGVSLNNFFREQIFDPLQMGDTHFYLPENKVNRLATLYTVNSDKRVVPTGEKRIQAGNLIYSSNSHYNGPQKYYSGGGGLVSTISDYGHFLLMLLKEGEVGGTRLLNSNSVKMMSKNQIDSLTVSPFTSHGNKYGYGFGVLTEKGKTNDVATIGTYSWGGVFNTYYWVDPQEDIVGILMTQLYPYNHLTLRTDFKKTVYKVIKN